MITAKYFCHACMTKKGVKPEMEEFVEVSVPERKQGENVVDYVQEVSRIVGVHHSHRGCNAKVCDLMLPAGNPQGISYPNQ